MLVSALSTIICDEFWRKFKAAESNKAMIVRFWLRSTSTEDLDFAPCLELLIWAPTNYVKVFVREKDATHGNTGKWTRVSNHDSAWTHDGVSQTLERYKKDIGGIDMSVGSWYEPIDPPDALPQSSGQLEDAATLPGLMRAKPLKP